MGLSFLVGVGGGFGAMVFRWLIEFFKGIFFGRVPAVLSFAGDHAVIFVPAIGALFFGPLIYFFAREAKGHGVPEVMEAMELKGGRIRPVVGVVKSLASSICIGSGGSVGREGPIVQVGSALGSTVGQVLRLPDERIKNLVACGAAGGIAATFNAPIGGLFFALEVILRDFSTRRLGGVVIASVTASVIGRVFLGDEPYVSVPRYSIKGPEELLFYVGFGLLIVPLSILFIRMIYLFEDLFEWLPVHDLSKPVIGGLLLGFIGFFYPQVFGVGYENIDALLNRGMPVNLMAALIPLKLIAVSLTLGSGGSGGVFAPSLVLGALSGGLFGTLLASIVPGIEPGAYALVGMAAFFAGAARAPITSILILFELTGDYLIILPLMLTVAITTVVAEMLHPESIYTLKLIRRGIDISKRKTYDILESIKVSEILGKETSPVPPCASVDDILSAFEKAGRATITVVDRDGVCCGIITLHEIITLLRNRDALGRVVVARDLVRDVPCLDESESLKEALAKFVKAGSDVLPVVRTIDGRRKLVGVISKDDILSAYRREVSLRKG